MPITTPQGTLDFKKVDRVTFVGASSNTVIDTTTGSLGVGVDGNGPTSKLHVVGNTRLEGDINMLHTSNTASIKLNSNVVAEFPRSKKLIKYPRVAMSQNALNNGYAAEASTENNGTSSGQAYRAFDGLANGERGYHSATVYTSGSTYNGTASITDADGTQHQGEWIKLQMPTTEKMKLSGFSFSPRYVSTAEYHHRTPYKGVFLGSTDGIGTNWYPIHYFDNVAGSELTTVSRTFENTTNDYYNHIALVVYEVGPNATYGDVLNLAEMELFGTPEYDPDAHGTDVTVKSKANVPNTDWLEVYYDAKGLPTAAVTTVNDLKPVGTANNGTVGGNTSVTDEAFTFDGTGDYITSTVTTGSGNQSFSVACWFKFTTLGGLLWGFTGTTDGTSGSNPTNNSTPHAYFNTTGSINFDFWANSTVTAEKLIEANRWYAGVWTYDGTTRKIYIDGTQVHLPQSSTPLSIIDNTSRLSIGIYPTNLSGGPMTGSIANFRLFNRALTSDEIYQLYAYQKEDFGHGDLSMTLKAGRLGIGTSEPRAALDVRGDIIGGCPVLFDCVASSTTAVGSYINWNLVKLNKGSGLNGTTFTAPVAGHYFFHVHVMGVWTTSSADVRFIMEWHKNGVHYGITNQTDSQMYDGRNGVDADTAHMKLSGSIIPYLEIGDTIKIIVDSHSTMGVHGRYNRFTGHYIG